MHWSCSKSLLQISAYPDFRIESDISECFLKDRYYQRRPKQLWCFQTSGRSAFKASMTAKEYEIQFEKDRPKSIKIILFFVCI